MRLVFNHVQYHIELCLQGMFLPLATGSRGGKGGSGKKKQLSLPRSLPSQSLQGGGWALSLSPSAGGLGCLESENLWSRTFWRGCSPGHSFGQCRKTSSELMRWGRLQAGSKWDLNSLKKSFWRKVFFLEGQSTLRRVLFTALGLFYKTFTT